MTRRGAGTTTPGGRARPTARRYACGGARPAAPRREHTRARRGAASAPALALGLAVLASLGAASALGGCLWTSRSEGTRLSEQASDHARRIDALERAQEEARNRLEVAVSRAETKVMELEAVLERATEVVTRNSADQGLLVQQLQEQVGALEGRIAELQQENQELRRQLAQQRTELDERVTQVARKAGLDMPVPDAEIPRDKTEHFAAAYRAFQAADHSRARALFRAYVERYRGDDQVDNALYWIGASYLAENRPATALGEFRKILAEHPRGDALDETLLDMGEAFWRLRACTDARTTWETLVRTQPTSPLVARARDKLRELSRVPRAQCSS
jgi:TolA-binding protein